MLDLVHIGAGNETKCVTPFISLKTPHTIKYIRHDKIYQNPEQLLFDYCQNNPVDIAFIDPQCNEDAYMDYKVLDNLLKQNIKIVLMFVDSVWQKTLDKMLLLADHCTVTTILDDPSVVKFRPDKFLWMFSHPNHCIFDTQFKHKRNISVSHAGNVVHYPDRMKYLYYIKDKTPLIVCGGDSGNPPIADIFYRSKISLNFSLVVGGHAHQLKCRTIEAPAAGSMLLESDNPLIETMYIPFKEYIPFYDEEDLLLKIKYYILNDYEREKVARAGYEKVHKEYNMDKWWERLGNKLGVNFLY